MNEIAAKLRINKASSYHYCRNKDEIAIEILQLNVEYVRDIFEEVEVNCENGMEKLRYFWMGYVKLTTTPIGAAGILTKEALILSNWAINYLTLCYLGYSLTSN